MPVNSKLLSRLGRLEQRFASASGKGLLYAILDNFADESELDAQVKELERQAEADGKELCVVIVHCAHEETTKPAKPEPRPQQQVGAAEPRPKQEPQPAGELLAEMDMAKGGNPNLLDEQTGSPPTLAVKRKGKRKPKPEPEPEPLTPGERRRQRRAERFRRWRQGGKIY